MAAAMVVAALAPTLASAANGNMPRTPALFPPHPCLSQVDRSQTTRFHFDVHIPYEDTQLTADELDDSRRFQFFALCREPNRLEVLPNWIAPDDTMRALAAGIIDALPPDDAYLLGNAAWTPGHDGATDSCVQIVDAMRMPISCEATVPGVEWDVSAVPAGNYVIRGYTFAPANNLWTSRIGVVQIHDGEPLPVAALVSPVYDAKAFQDDGYRVLGCMDGPPGTTVTLQYASTASDDLGDDAAWTTFAEHDASARWIDERLALTADTVYQGLLLRAIARGPDGAQWIAHSPGFVTVYPGDGTSDDPVPAPGADHCDAGGDESGGIGEPIDDTGDGATTGGGSTGAGVGDPPESGESEGCGCRSGPRSSVNSAIPWALTAALVRRRRRRSA